MTKTLYRSKLVASIFMLLFYFFGTSSGCNDGNVPPRALPWAGMWQPFRLPALRAIVVKALAAFLMVLLLASCRQGGRVDSFVKTPLPIMQVQTGAILGLPTLSDNGVVLGTQDGKVLFLRGGGQQLKLSSWAITSPVSRIGARYFAGDEDGTLFCFSQQGDIHWRFKTEGKITGGVIAWGDMLIFGSYDQTLYALARADGALRWRYETKGFIHGTPAMDQDHGWIFLGNCDGFLRKIAADDGRLLAEMDLASPIPASVVYDQGQCFLLTHGGMLSCVDGESLKPRWQTATEQDFTSSPLLLADAVLTCSAAGEVAIYQRADGQLRLRLPAELRLAPLAAYSRHTACGVSTRGKLYLFPAARNYEALLLADYHCDVEFPPVCADGQIAFVDDQGGAWLVQASPALIRQHVDERMEGDL